MATQILIVMMAAIGLTIFAEARQFQAPLLLVIVGMIVSYIPGIPPTEIEPEIILGLVLPPLLFSAALDFSFFSFMRRVGSIANLGIFLVTITAIVVSVLLSGWLTVLTIPGALILGAVIAPTDAVSAISIGERLGLTKRLMTVLKGESLVNDAAALTLFTLATAAATGEKTFISNGVLYFLFAAGLGAILGLILGNIVHAIRRKLHNATMVTALTIITPFAAYLLAEELHMSGVMCVVFTGFALGFHATDLKFDGRIQQREVMQLVDALLEAFVFSYLGLQFRFVLEGAISSGTDIWSLFKLSGLTLAVVIVVRIVWILCSAALGRLIHRRRLARAKTHPPRRPLADPLSWKENLVLSWSGMRGVVTVAAAAGTPLLTSTGEALPDRDLIIAIAFLVAIGTLIFQGLSLPWLIGWLKIDSSSDAAYRVDQFGIARAAMIKAGKEAADRFRAAHPEAGQSRVAELVLSESQREAMLKPREGEAPIDRDLMFTLVRDVQSARRGALIAERNAGRLNDEALRELLEGIDLEQALMARRGQNLIDQQSAR
ncbi:sodium:proton antiporter [Devosia sp.]|uniref:cation:proton antiporter n=1 Tax=Devosia sp. TaxID=1871048 RepID=UPI00326520FD